MRAAAVEHRRVRPEEDVVFLVVPSTAVRVMKTFGVSEFYRLLLYDVSDCVVWWEVVCVCLVDSVRCSY